VERFFTALADRAANCLWKTARDGALAREDSSGAHLRHACGWQPGLMHSRREQAWERAVDKPREAGRCRVMAVDDQIATTCPGKRQ
jgi:hypothetical protein